MFGYINMTRVIYAEMKALDRGVIVDICGIAGKQMPICMFSSI
jgi:NADP-dependent 3-hydroxy acid dehydrogenase YdfG